ncbi:hypothetical protein VTG60DRAFT_3731 [Thermothelomyces hinnuleus]
MAAITSNDFVSWDDFVRIRNSQDEQLGREFGAVRQRLDGVEQTVAAEFRMFRDLLVEVQLDSRRTAARLQNYMLKHSYLPISPVPAYDPLKGIIDPDPALFPGSVGAFYKLLHPSNDAEIQMLSYLISFYDIQLFTPQDEDEARPEVGDFERAVERLEVILGLNGDNFSKFKEPLAEGHGAEGRRPRLEQRPNIPVEHKSRLLEEFSNNTRLEWRVRTRSTPSSQRPRINNLKKATEAEKLAEQEPLGSDATGLTRPFITPREL